MYLPKQKTHFFSTAFKVIVTYLQGGCGYLQPPEEMLVNTPNLNSNSLEPSLLYCICMASILNLLLFNSHCH